MAWIDGDFESTSHPKISLQKKAKYGHFVHALVSSVLDTLSFLRVITIVVFINPLFEWSIKSIECPMNVSNLCHDFPIENFVSPRGN